MRPNTEWLLIIGANISLVLGVFVFAFGFFPYKAFLPGLSVFDDAAESIKAPFDKVVFMVVDALRSDFVYSNTSNFKFTQSLISSGAAFPFTAHAGAPTITMPRIKSMLTGSVPGFLDLILNFAESDTTSTLSNQDNWPAQIKARGGKVVMYGDDTWIKLLPGVFHRSEGTTSFFVSDFVEVDNNVTRHIDRELANDDWNALILHYLGLDHVGHKAGPKSAYMAPKQAEMDGIIKKIYSAIKTRPQLNSTLFILCGDHGMNDAGGHGGSTPGEASAALLFMSPKFKPYTHGGFPAPAYPHGEFQFHTIVEQADIAATLAGLMHLPIPRNNLGAFIPSFLEMYGERDRVTLLMHNAKQMLQAVKATYPGFDRMPSGSGECEYDLEPVELACLWSRVREKYVIWNGKQKLGLGPAETGLGEVVKRLLRFIKRTQSILSMAASNYNLNLMGLGMIICFLAATVSTVVMFSSSYPFSASNERFQASIILMIITILNCIMMFASSFVEEEQNFWYWATSGWFVVLFFRERRLNPSMPTPNTAGLPSLLLLLLHRISRRWNQTGQKYQGASDIVTGYLTTHPSAMWTLIFATYTYIAYRLHSEKGSVLKWFAGVVAGFGAMFKIDFALHDAGDMVPGWVEGMVRWGNGASESVDGNENAEGWWERIGLVGQARTVFLAIGVAAVFAILGERRVRRVGEPIEDVLLDDDVAVVTDGEDDHDQVVHRRRNSSLSSSQSSPVFRVSPLPPQLRGTTTSETLHSLLLLLLVTQSRFWNIPLLLISAMQLRILTHHLALPLPLSSSSPYNPTITTTAIKTVLPSPFLTITLILLQHTAFFALGGSNNISSLDLSSSFNGVSGYHPIPVGLLGFLGNFAGPVWFTLAAYNYIPSIPSEPPLLSTPLEQEEQEEMEEMDMDRDSDGEPEEHRQQSFHHNHPTSSIPLSPPLIHFASQTVFFAWAALAVMASCTALRTHLFIWTVFSPKYVYTMMWTVLVHALVGGMVGAGMWRLGGGWLVE